MLVWVGAKSRIESDPSVRHQGPVAGAGGASARGLGRSEDRRFVAGPGGSASELDCRSPRFDAHEPEPLDSPGKCPRRRGSKTSAPKGTAFPADTHPVPSLGEGSGEVAAGAGVKPSAMGWSHLGNLLEAALRDKLEGPPSAVLDAPAGLSLEAGRLQLSPGARRGGPAVPAGAKKNSAAWVSVRRWLFKTRPVSPCIRDWAGVGPNAASGCGLPPPVAITLG